MQVRLGEVTNALVSLMCATAYGSRPRDSRLPIVLSVYSIFQIAKRFCRRFLAIPVGK